MIDTRNTAIEGIVVRTGGDLVDAFINGVGGLGERVVRYWKLVYWAMKMSAVPVAVN